MFVKIYVKKIYAEVGKTYAPRRGVIGGGAGGGRPNTWFQN